MDKHIKLTRSQKEVAEVWLFDPMNESFPGALSGSVLVVRVEDLEDARGAIQGVLAECYDLDAHKDLTSLAIRL